VLTDAFTTVWVESLAAGLTKEGHMCALQTSSQLRSGFHGNVYFPWCFEALCTCEHKWKDI